MAYNAVAQVDEVASSSDSNSDVSRSASPAFQPLHDADPLQGTQLESARSDVHQGLGHLRSMIRSMTTASYDIVEADDYDADPSLAEPSNRSNSLRRIPPLNTAVARHSFSPEPPLRSASSDLPITHPIPDLQSSQGAYVGNVARLEQSAEQLSSSSADIASEIRRMDQEQKRRSCSSASNSVNLRNGAFSPATIASHGSTFSTRQRSVSGASRLAQLPEPDHDEDGHSLGRMPVPSAIAPIHQAPIYTQPHDPYYDQYDGHREVQEDLERPASAASGDTFQQARTLFTDFDGVHFAPLDRANSGRQLSLSQPPLASKPESYREPQTGENMVYYPAPVPRMLNLPPKLSRKPISDREKRRTELLTNIVAEDRKSALWAAGSEQNKLGERDRRQSKIPPQLRASLFFDKPSTTLEVDVKQESAVATLDSILDASAHAPVSAFTDHPYAGQVGSYVFQQSKRKTLYKDSARPKADRNSHIPMGQRHSTRRGSDGEEGSASSRDGHGDRSHDEHDSDRSSSSDTEGDEHSPESGEEGEEEEDEGFVDYVGPPNTLLAELDLRKQELKQRQRAFLPTASQAQGMHATLLELDAMAQKQSDKRRRRPVTLAWGGNHDTADDDDVPLAMLYPDQVQNDEEGRPLGLMERRQLEENEPLSTRRARLRGEPVPEKHTVTVHETEILQPDADSGDEGETLAERMKRLRGQDPADSEFASELLAEIDTRTGVAPKQPEPAPAADALENETLAQRRSRLQKENGPPRGNAKNLHMRRSMAALPQTRPAQHITRQSSHDVLPYGNAMSGQYANRMSMLSLPLNPGQQASMAYPMGAQQPYGYGGMGYPAAQAYNSMMMGVPGGMAYAMPAGCGPNMTRQPVDPAQQEFIDRWRQSIR
ncbi:hypothetical protein PMG11_04721 [Penicillium brasilianum]|uniref:Uncharacterized protein n=1 Tax=Penicillium brasilianum TaxID=104259 RepID=A0A0F7VDI0_PENBI|nr:hypothetical protein PMG11_04721 [Penicillium brasilianum]